ncbi:hypothetical protein R5R35_003211 [Gryllus longicercus]|uniref:F-BAR and double SH3 domains protein 2 n=1 Tax=Gryllus longicercus TaxID=2509291 RepID=A0AAN9VIH3_9ORTH
MQPPPRKGNYAKFLKTLHSEQVAKLQAKNQHECDLLEDIRNFTLKRSAIEKSYSEALLKISSAFLNKKIPNIPDIKLDGGEEKWNMWNVWRTVLEENEKLARARLAAVEVFHQQIADDAKILRAQKVQTARKCVEQLQVIQKELQMCVQDVDKTKKMYFEEEHSAHDVRDKAKDIEEKLKKKKGSFFQSITSLQKNSAKVSSKREQLEEKSTGARNEYLLSLASANAHQTRYFVVDLQNTMTTMENCVFEKVAEYLMLIGRTELLTCSATQTSFTRIRDQAQQLTREYNMQCLYLYYPVLKQHVQYDFEACENDTVDKVTAEHASAVQSLSKEARRWATRITRENNNIREYTRKLHIYQQMRDSGQKTDPNDINGPDLETKIEELRQGVRRSETSKLKAEARIECLRNGGVNVDEWMQEADNLSVQDLPRSASSLSVRTDASGTGEPLGSDGYYDSDADAGSEAAVAAVAAPAAADAEPSGDAEERDQDEGAEVDGEWAMVEQERQRLEQLTAGWDDPTQVDWGPDDSEVSAAPDANTDSLQTVVTAPPSADHPCKCIALYNYTAQNDDELSIVENEQLEVLGEGDGDGWLRARNYRGQEGYVPHNYLDVDGDSASAGLGWAADTSAAGSSYQLHSQISFSSVDYTVDEGGEAADAEVAAGVPEEPAAVGLPAAPAPAPPPSAEPGARSASPAPADAQADHAAAVDIPAVAVDGGPADARAQGVAGFCLALYDYEAGCEDELTFYEGQVIRILSKVPHNVDDGWWEGEVDGRTGIFPSLVVEECREDGEPFTPQGEDEPPSSAPPVFTPPDVPVFLLAPQQVIITQPTPEMDATPGDQQVVDMPRVTVDEVEMAEEKGAERGVESSRPPFPKPLPPSSGGEGLGLEVAQIVITAATPTVEEPEQLFPSAEEPEPTAEEEKEEESKVANANDEEENVGAEPTPVPPSEERRASGSPAPDLDEDLPTDSAPFPISSSTGSEEDTYTGPSTAENSQSQPAPAPAGQQLSADDDCAAGAAGEAAEAAEAGQADQAGHAGHAGHAGAAAEAGQAGQAGAAAEAGQTAEAGQAAAARVAVDAVQPVGGRGSIPDELEPHQLAKLQDLKESNA